MIIVVHVLFHIHKLSYIMLFNVGLFHVNISKFWNYPKVYNFEKIYSTNHNGKCYFKFIKNTYKPTPIPSNVLFVVLKSLYWKKNITLYITVSWKSKIFKCTSFNEFIYIYVYIYIYTHIYI